MDAQATEAALQQVAEMMPEPLYEAANLEGEHLCLVCGKNIARSALRSPSVKEPIVPLCSDCSSNWNIYGYLILKGIRPVPLVMKMAGFFLYKPARRLVVWQDLRNLMRWQKKMLRLRTSAKGK